jgi:hypothetical protein
MTDKQFELRPSGFKGDQNHRRKWFNRNCTRRICMLIVVNEARRVLHIFENKCPEDRRPREAIEAAMKVADKDAGYMAAATTIYGAGRAAEVWDDEAASAAAMLAAGAASTAAAFAKKTAEVAAEAVSTTADTVEQDKRMSLYIPVSDLTRIPTSWLTQTITSLAETMYTDQTWSLAPILADALMDAGCEHEEVLGILRSHWNDFGRGVWIIDQLTGRK